MASSIPAITISPQQLRNAYKRFNLEASLQKLIVAQSVLFKNWNPHHQFDSLKFIYSKENLENWSACSKKLFKAIRSYQINVPLSVRKMIQTVERTFTPFCKNTAQDSFFLLVLGKISPDHPLLSPADNEFFMHELFLRKAVIDLNSLPFSIPMGKLGKFCSELKLQAVNLPSANDWIKSILSFIKKYKLDFTKAEELETKDITATKFTCEATEIISNSRLNQVKKIQIILSQLSEIFDTFPLLIMLLGDYGEEIQIAPFKKDRLVDTDPRKALTRMSYSFQLLDRLILEILSNVDSLSEGYTNLNIEMNVSCQDELSMNLFELKSELESLDLLDPSKAVIYKKALPYKLIDEIAQDTENAWTLIFSLFEMIEQLSKKKENLQHLSSALKGLLQAKDSFLEFKEQALFPVESSCLFMQEIAKVSKNSLPPQDSSSTPIQPID